MTLFRYVAIDPEGRQQTGTMEAPDEASVVARLQRDGHIPMRAEPARNRSGLIDLLNTNFTRGGLRGQELADFTRELAIMLTAGQDLDRALRYLVDTARNRRVATLLEQLRSAVRDGSALAAAMGRHPRSFSQLYIGLVRAGEAGGNLAPTLERLALLLERERSLIAAVRSAMIYPGLLLLATVGSVVLLLTEVLPQFAPLFAQNGVSLPASTQFLIDSGAFVSSYGVYMLLAIALLSLLMFQLLRRPGPRLLADKTLLRLPIIGSLAREVLAARLSRTLGTLLLNGVPLIAALGIVRDVVGNRAAMAAVERATSSAKSGAGLSQPLRLSGVFPLRTTYLLRLGEETAQLGQMALRAAEIHEESTRLGVQRLVSLLVPGITIVMGGLVAGVVSSLILAMLSLNDLAH